VILYVDTSSLVKIYVEETGSDLVREWVDEAEAIATSCVAYPEAMSAFARRREKGDLEAGSFQDVQETLESDWPSFVQLPVRERRAGALAVKHLLRGFDAVHLAAAIDLRDALGSDTLVFSSFDRKLLTAAGNEGFPVLGLELESAP
jgi:predicted nucleic acid-binding protein